MVALTIASPGKPTVNLDFTAAHPKDVTVKQLKIAVQAKFPKLVSNRQRITLPGVASKAIALTDEDKTLADYGVGEGAKLRLKDLGQQVGYRTLYLWEYAGPIVLNPLLLYYSHAIWGQYDASPLQLTVRNLIVIHFIKRFLESAFVHDFSRATVPLSFVFRNCAYYWGICGGLIGLTLYRPAYAQQALEGTLLGDSRWITFWTIFELAKLLNLNAHIHLRSLRQPAGQPRLFPTGLGFGTAVCANYWFEILGVIALVAMTGFDIGTVIYLCIGTYFMKTWADGKYARYKREFDNKVFPGKRYKLFPPLY
ncbi:enoyl reductase [Cryptococcus wingfieldii CBS 7118]|uniref:Enoyl reductase n=1 Tax=Cryptococcus wingfieldii CBS 7118 TaxID=1295528 RepID=A0A1E3JIG6_9TREE|nr:enoyl reductase [Cryptococcus wingfieldii CBS 7118]ODO00684.1 enoyl reductase [Cryptococcus wingfieldii CBS 7118]